MAHHDMNTLMSTSEMVRELVSKPFRSLGVTLARFVEANPLARARMESATTVAKMSDADLAKRGITRAYAIQCALRRFD